MIFPASGISESKIIKNSTKANEQETVNISQYTHE